MNTRRRHLKERSRERYNVPTNRKLVRAIERLIHSSRKPKYVRGDTLVIRFNENLFKIQDKNKGQYLVRVVHPGDHRKYWFLIGYKNEITTFLPLENAFWYAAELPDVVNSQLWQQYLTSRVLTSDRDVV